MPGGVPGVRKQLCPLLLSSPLERQEGGVQETRVVLGTSKGSLISQHVYSEGAHIGGEVKEWFLTLLSLIGPVLFQGRQPHRAPFCCCNHCLDYTTASSTFSHAAALSQES